MEARDFDRLVRFVREGFVRVHVTKDRHDHRAYVVNSRNERIEQVAASQQDAENLVAAGAIWVASFNELR